MKKFIPITLFILAFTCLGFYSYTPPKSATCTGSKSCKACKNCKYCKHCAKEGGTCGVCKK